MVPPAIYHFLITQVKVIANKIPGLAWHRGIVKKTCGVTSFPLFQLLFDFVSYIASKLILEIHLCITSKFHTICAMNSESREYFSQVLSNDIVKKQDMMIVMDDRQFEKPGEIGGGYV